MNTEEYLNYLQESQHIAEDSYNYIGEIYKYYIDTRSFEENIHLLRDERIDEILK